MAQQFPEDIWHLIFAELRIRRDFQSLFNASQLSKALAHLALANLYRITNQSPGTDEEGEGAHNVGLQEDTLFLKWLVFWSSVVQSCAKSTLYPYASYLRNLDFRDLQNMFDDPKFTKHESKYFRGPLAKFRKQRKVQLGKTTVLRLDQMSTIAELGSMLTQHTPLLEQLSGSFDSNALLEWIPRLPKLQRLELWDGVVLGDEQIHSAIYQSCPRFSELSIFLWRQVNADSKMGSFLEGLPKQSLITFTTIDDCNTSLQTCLALGNHGTSLRELDMYFETDGVPYMGMLRGCTSIEKLHLSMPSFINLESDHGEVFKEVVAWLSECRNLKEIELTDFVSSPALLLPILLNDQVRLEGLSVNGSNTYTIEDARDFHRVLSNKPSLRSLDLKGEGEDGPTEDTETLVNSVKQLTGLRKLHLRGLADSFDDDRIIKILGPLQNLEELSMGGWNITDGVLNTVAHLSMLKSITFNALTEFTVEGLLDFVTQAPYREGGMRLSVDSADPPSALSDLEISLVREAITAKFGYLGRFDYILWREQDAQSFDEDSD